ncbi:MAG: hypothetical protein V4819_05885 [Verrucomicrobiota bacterium]
MDDDQQSKRWSLGDQVFVVVLVALFIIGVYRAYRTFVVLGGIRGELALAGQFLVEIVLVLAAFVAYIACFALVHLAVSIVTGTKLRRVRVFISFKHDHEGIATELEQALADRYIEVIKLPFLSGRDHDDVVRQSLAAVSAADAVVVVPG